MPLTFDAVNYSIIIASFVIVRMTATIVAELPYPILKKTWAEEAARL